MSAHNHDHHGHSPSTDAWPSDLSHEAPNPATRSAGFAAFVGLFFGGLVFLYALPLKKGIPAMLVTYAVVILSGGVLLVPVFAGCALAGAYFVRVTDGAFDFAGGTRRGYRDDKGLADPVAPGLYQILRKSPKR